MSGRLNKPPETSQLNQQAEHFNEEALENLVLLLILAALSQSTRAGSLQRLRNNKDKEATR